MIPVEQLLVLAAQTLSEAGLDFALIGGCARNFYAEPRATRDVDLAVLLDATGWKRLVEAMARRGFSVAATVGPSPEQPDLAHFRNPENDRIDLLFARTEFETEALSRSRNELRIGPTLLPVVTPEDLIVFKLIAGRSQDLVDAEEIAATIRASGNELDWVYVERWCREWEILDRLSRIREALTHD